MNKQPKHTKKNKEKEMNEHVNANKARGRISNLVRKLSQYFVGRYRKRPDGNRERDEIIFLMTVAMVAREPMLLLGEPGTAKSAMVIKFKEACGAEKYFEYMLTMFTELSEIIGPVSIKELRKNDKYLRILDNRIADAQIVFLDEIFKGNSAILNSLLTLLNEHKIYQGTQVKYLPDNLLLGFFAAGNEIPDNAEILPLKDRFPIKVMVNRVPEDQFFDLIQVGVQNDINQNRQVKTWENICCLEDFITVRKYLFQQFDNSFHFSDEMGLLFRRIITTLRNEYKISISDRQIVKLHRLISTRAYLDRGALPKLVRPQDMIMLRYTAERLEDFEPVFQFVNQVIQEVEE